MNKKEFLAKLVESLDDDEMPSLSEALQMLEVKKHNLAIALEKKGRIRHKYFGLLQTCTIMQCNNLSFFAHVLFEEQSIEESLKELKESMQSALEALEDFVVNIEK